jgi:putative inorganic carbon (hco3(-)) transporter
MSEIGFKIYLLFTMSWFLHLTQRIAFLGAMRFDLLLALLLIIIAFLNRPVTGKSEHTEIDRILSILMIYVFLTIPLAEWPGTVIKSGFPEFIKAVVFYYFTVSFITSERKLKIYLIVYLACQTFRVLEPLYLHITEGYWGSQASLNSWEFMMRLSGSPHDVMNPNGLASVIVSIIPFLYFYSASSWVNKLILILLLPALLYAFVLTGSRSGFIVLGIVVASIIYRSKRKAVLIPLVVISTAFIFLNMSADLQDRYLSIFSSNTKNASTAQQRVTGIEDNFQLFLHKPIFGFGLGTSEEANYNYGTSVQPPHNLYMDVGVQLGLIGMIIFILFMKSIVTIFISSYNLIIHNIQESSFLLNTAKAVQIIIIVEIVFSFASYGLLIPSWYLLAGLTIVLVRLASQKVQS